MHSVFYKRMTARPEEDFVVFLIGMRINKLWKVHKWLPVARAMPGMLGELYAQPELGLLHHEQWFGRTIVLIQYWRSFELLEAYAKSRSAKHLPAWAAFNKQNGTNGDVGIWHETYRIEKGHCENIYVNMPPFGLGKAFDLVEAAGGFDAAKGRMGS